MPLRRRCWSALLLILLAPAAQAAPSIRTDAEVAIGTDDNVLNAPKGENTLITPFHAARLAVDVSQVVAPTLVLGTRLQLEGEDVWDVDRLANAKGTALVRATFRPDGAFLTPSLTFWGSVADWRFKDDLRDSHELRAGARIDQALTTRLGVRAEFKTTRRMADNRVFDNDAVSAALGADWRVHDRVAVRLGYEFIAGEMVTSARGAAVPVEVREATVEDDLYPGNEAAYRVEAHTQVGTAGLNWRFSPRLALDVEARGAWAEGRQGLEYERTRGTLSLLARF